MGCGSSKPNGVPLAQSSKPGRAPQAHQAASRDSDATAGSQEVASGSLLDNQTSQQQPLKHQQEQPSPHQQLQVVMAAPQLPPSLPPSPPPQQQQQRVAAQAPPPEPSEATPRPGGPRIVVPTAATATADRAAPGAISPLSEEEEELLLLLLQKKQRQLQDHKQQQQQQPLQEQEQQRGVQQQQQQDRPPLLPPPQQQQMQMQQSSSLQHQDASYEGSLDGPGQRVAQRLQLELQGELQQLEQQQLQCEQLELQQQQQGQQEEGPLQQEELSQQHQQQLQERLAGLSMEQLHLLQMKLQERLQQQLRERLRQQQELQEALEREERERAEEAARRREQRQQRREQREEQQGQLQAQYEQDLLQRLLLPLRSAASASASAAAGDATLPSSSPSSSGAAAATARPAVPVRVWSGDSGDGSLLFPELDDLDFKVAGITRKAPLALCVAGGALREAWLGLGWLRSLQVMGLLSKAQYLCTSESSSWLSVISFRQIDELDELLGSHISLESGGGLEALPQEDNRGCGGEGCDGVVDAHHGSLARALADVSTAAVSTANSGSAGGSCSGGDSGGGDSGQAEEDQDSTAVLGLAQAINKALLEPLGLGGADGCTASMSGTKGHVHETVAKRAAQLGLTPQVANPQLPFPVICQSLEVREADDTPRCFPYEWTPLYGGCPVPYDWTIPKLGGGWVELLGAYSELISQPPTAAASGCEVRVRPMGPSPSLAVTLALGSATATATGSRGSGGNRNSGSSVGNGGAWQTDPLIVAPPGALSASLKPEGCRSSELNLVVPYFDQQVWTNSRVSLRGGVGSDLTALYPALRRRVTNILSLCSPRGLLRGNSSTSDEEGRLLSQCQVARELLALFGRWSPHARSESREALSGLPPPAEYNRQRQVFPAEALDELLASLESQMAGGELGNGGVVHMAKYEVLQNPHMGVPGGWTVHIMWVIQIEPRRPAQGRTQGQEQQKMRETAGRAAGMLLRSRGMLETLLAGGGVENEEDDY